MKILSSVKNPAVQEAKALSSPKERRERRAFLLDGEHMVSEALRVCPDRVRAVFVEDARAESYAEWLALAPASAEVYAVPARVLEAVSQVKTSQGIAAVCGMPPETPLSEMRGRLILLENVQDPGNVGTVLRTIDAAGFDGCILTPGCADPFGPKTLRATMGSLFRVKLAWADSAAGAAAALVARGFEVIGAELRGEPFYSRPAAPADLCVLIGNEGAGLTPEALAACTRRYRLPMRGGAESLNAAVAAAVMMYDLVNRP